MVSHHQRGRNNYVYEERPDILLKQLNNNDLDFKEQEKKMEKQHLTEKKKKLNIRKLNLIF